MYIRIKHLCKAG